MIEQVLPVWHVTIFLFYVYRDDRIGYKWYFVCIVRVLEIKLENEANEHRTYPNVDQYTKLMLLVTQ